MLLPVILLARTVYIYAVFQFAFVVVVIASRFVGVAIQELTLFLLSLLFFHLLLLLNGISVSGLPRGDKAPLA
jgi:hypothetical protein